MSTELRDSQAATIGGRLAVVAARHAAKTAITEGEASISYADLDAAATAVASRLAAIGGQRPGFVCLLFSSKLAAIGAMLGANRCGRAYVSLDASDPDKRLRFMVKDSEPIAVLTEAALLERARALAGNGCEAIDIGTMKVGSVERQLPAASPDATAYVVYTSGSTGTPKGVCQTQRNLLFFADAFARALEITEADRVSLVFSLSFGASNMNIFPALLNGATLCAFDVRAHGVAKLVAWLDRERISVLHTTPTLFRELMSSLGPDRRLAHLRAINLSSEALFASDVELFRRHTREDCILVNHLGATEASVIAQYRIDRRPGAYPSGVLPAGRSPEGVRVLIRREDGSAAAADEIGEIVVCSSHVSPGYWRRPELNASTFEADPGPRGERRYFTRDLGRIGGTGNLHFLGRKGSRVKIRGCSVDLTEVEAALSACTGVTKAAALATGGGPGKEAERLTAYIVAATEGEGDPLRIRRQLAKRLPPYMLPTAFVFLDAFPLTASGKVDRTALSAIEPAPDARPFEPPRDDIEKAIAGIFAELLAQSSIGRDDDFFLLGGDSLLLVELQTRLRDAFGVSLGDFYEDATVSGIAASVRASGARNSASEPRPLPVLFPLRSEGDKPPLFLLHARLGQALVSPHFMRLLGDDQPVWAFQARGLDGLAAPHTTIEAMAADYLAELRKRRPEGPYFIGSLCAGALIAVVMARTLSEMGETVLPLLLLDPPKRAFAMADTTLTEERLLKRIKNKQVKGTIAAPVDDPSYAQASVRVARAMEQAIREHRPQPYYGPVYMLASRGRIEDSKALTELYRGKVTRYEVAANHRQILDAHNELFAAQLSRCLEEIRQVA